MASQSTLNTMSDLDLLNIWEDTDAAKPTVNDEIYTMSDLDEIERILILRGYLDTSGRRSLKKPAMSDLIAAPNGYTLNTADPGQIRPIISDSNQLNRNIEQAEIYEQARDIAKEIVLLIPDATVDQYSSDIVLGALQFCKKMLLSN